MPFRSAVCSWSCRVVAACCVLTARGVPSLAVEIAPYAARVVAAGATVHSGPGEKFYPTDSLALGDLVEVYQEKPGGWLGIRPTVNSFSWVKGGEVTVKDGGLGEVVRDGVASRIGSRLSDKHNAAQIRLRKGELVEVLGEENLAGETWYKIAPPAGEFRWIQAALVERTGPLGAAAAAAAASAPAAPPKGEPASPTTEFAAPPLTPSTTPTDWKSSPPAEAAASPAAGSPPAVVPPTVPTSSPPPSANVEASASDLRPVPMAAATAATTFEDELAAVEVRLSRMASAPTNLWNTERLERDAMQLLGRAQTPSEREAVRNTLTKISQFAAIGRRTNGPATALAQAGPPAGAPVPGAAPPAASGQYDAVGILRPVVSRRPGAPQFALVDDRGQVLSFITPSPDVNLQAYLGRRVGVVGNRGFIAEFNRSHVTAARVTPMVR